MNKEEPSLSDKIQDSSEFRGAWLWAEDVKQKVKRLKEFINDDDKTLTIFSALNEVNKIFGDDLI